MSVAVLSSKIRCGVLGSLSQRKPLRVFLDPKSWFSVTEYRPKSLALKVAAEFVTHFTLSEFGGSFYIAFSVVLWLTAATSGCFTSSSGWKLVIRYLILTRSESPTSPNNQMLKAFNDFQALLSGLWLIVFLPMG